MIKADSARKEKSAQMPQNPSQATLAFHLYTMDMDWSNYYGIMFANPVLIGPRIDSVRALFPLSSETPHPIALDPFPDLSSRERHGPALPRKPDDVTPRARPPRIWTKWIPAILALVVIVAASQSIGLPPIPMLIAFVALMILGTTPFLPREGSPARRRLPLLTILPLPWITSLLVGPLAEYFTNGREILIADKLIALHYGLLGASAALPFLIMPVMHDARRFTLILGILNLVLTFLATSVGIITLIPGS